jgi:hypothetical protein
MDPSSVCRLHPGVAVTGFCPACLRDRLAGLQPPSSGDLRRCKSFSYARSAAASHLEPQRRSCDLFRQEPGSTAMEVPDQQEEEERKMEASRKSSSFGGLLGKKLQQWRRKKKEHSFRGEQLVELGVDSRRSCDLGSYASWESSGLMFDRPAAEEDSIQRSDGQIPVEEEDHYKSVVDVPGGCAQTRDYYLDSSSSGRRRQSSTTSGRNSFSDVAINNELATNARVSPAIAHHQSHQHQHQYRSRDCWDQPGPGPTNFSGRRDDDFLFRGANKEANKPNKKKGIKGWSIWGLIHKKSSRKLPEEEADVHRSSFSPSSGAGVQVEYPWPEFRARGYNGQMLRCNSSISARRSISGTGVETQNHVNGHGSGRMRMDQVLLERTMSTRSSSYSTPAGHDHPMGAAANYQQLNHNGVRSKPSALPRRTRRSTLGP